MLTIYPPSLLIFLLAGCGRQASGSEALLITRIQMPEAFLVEGPEDIPFRGDIRMGDLSGNGEADFLDYRSKDDAHDGGGMKPRFLEKFCPPKYPLTKNSVLDPRRSSLVRHNPHAGGCQQAKHPNRGKRQPYQRREGG